MYDNFYLDLIQGTTIFPFWAIIIYYLEFLEKIFLEIFTSGKKKQWQVIKCQFCKLHISGDQKNNVIFT